MAELESFASRAEAAFLAAAVGDALGWPQENRAGRVGGQRAAKPQLAFVEWRRRAGGRYASHEEIIGGGEYSDDTQLLAAVGRCLLSGPGWWDRLTRTELPFWLQYERGGGGATKRAAQSWKKGSPPWEGEAGKRYFSAGGNGVAMRVLPHCINTHDDFERVAEQVFADGIATHGHPRALIGALAHAYMLWKALRRRDRLPYGALVGETLDQVATWSRLPTLDDFARTWRSAAIDHTNDSYGELWTRTISEMQGLLAVCSEALEQGSLSVDHETLTRLGVFDKQVSSAGTVTAAAALFLASRYASQPGQGLLAAAFAPRADTDTLASMSASVLAAISGGDWLGKLREGVQDSGYLAVLARALTSGSKRESPLPPSSDTQTFVPGSSVEIGTDVSLPDGRRARIKTVLDHPTKTRNLVKTTVVETTDGQTLFFKQVRRLPEEPRTATPTEERPRRRRIGLELQVTRLERSVSFWRDIVQLEVTTTDKYVSVGGYIALVKAADSKSLESPQLPFGSESDLRLAPWTIVVFVDDREDLVQIHQRLRNANMPSLVLDGEESEVHRLRCTDPDGNVVEFRERNNIT